jgi:hypothetical protein
MVSNTADLAATDTNPPRQTSSRFPGWAIALIVCFLLAINVALGGWHVHRIRARRRAYILSTLEEGTQFSIDELRSLEMQTLNNAGESDTGGATATGVWG